MEGGVACCSMYCTIPAGTERRAGEEGRRGGQERRAREEGRRGGQQRRAGEGESRGKRELE